MRGKFALGKFFASLYRRARPFDMSADDVGDDGVGDDDDDDAFIVDTTVVELGFESVHPICVTSSSTLAFR